MGKIPEEPGIGEVRAVHFLGTLTGRQRGDHFIYVVVERVQLLASEDAAKLQISFVPEKGDLLRSCLADCFPLWKSFKNGHVDAPFLTNLYPERPRSEEHASELQSPYVI